MSSRPQQRIADLMMENKGMMTTGAGGVLAALLEAALLMKTDQFLLLKKRTWLGQVV